MELDKAIEKRRSARRFSSKKPNWRNIIDAVDAANKCPLAGNIYALRFVLVDDKEKILKLADAAQQQFFANIDYAVVVFSDKTQVVRSYGERGERYCRQQAGAAIQNFLLKIIDLGMAACWVGAFVDDEVKRVLEVPQPSEDILVEAIIPVGFDMPKLPAAKRDANLDNILWFNKWKNRQMHEMYKPEAS
jgi:nitroreductase